MPSQKKIDIVAKLKDKVGRAKSLVFADYQGLTHKQLESLKKAVKTTDAELVVTKNTLLKLALGKSITGQTGTTSTTGGSSSRDTRDTLTLAGPTAALFVYGDVIAPLRELAKIIKLFKLPTIKSAILDGKMIDAETVLRLASLPSREVLIAQLVGGMKAPIYGLHRALNWNLQKLVMTLKEIEKKKQ